MYLFNGNFVCFVFFQGFHGLPGEKGEKGDPGSQVTLFHTSKKENLALEVVLTVVCQRLGGRKWTSDWHTVKPITTE